MSEEVIGEVPEEMPEAMPEVISVDARLARSCYRIPGALDDKYTRGVALLAGGSKRYPGAGLLNALGAAGTGVGMIRFVSSARSTDLVLARLPEVVLEVGRFQAALVGSGWDSARLSEVQQVVKLAADLEVPLVVDAGALPFARGWLQRFPSLQMVLTPHVREAAGLLNVDPAWVAKDLVRAASRLASWGFTVCLKAAETLVADPDGQVYRYRAANAWGAVAGAGDVLAGVITGLLAQRQADSERSLPENSVTQSIAQGASEFASTGNSRGLALAKSVAAAVWLHGEAARRAAGQGAPIVASQISNEVPQAIASLVHQSNATTSANTSANTTATTVLLPPNAAQYSQQ